MDIQLGSNKIMNYKIISRQSLKFSGFSFLILMVVLLNTSTPTEAYNNQGDGSNDCFKIAIAESDGNSHKVAKAAACTRTTRTVLRLTRSGSKAEGVKRQINFLANRKTSGRSLAPRWGEVPSQHISGASDGVGLLPCQGLKLCSKP